MSATHRKAVVLVITHSNDNESIPMVMDAVASQGGIAYRFDTDRFPTGIRLHSHYSDEAQRRHLVCNDYELDLDAITAVWYRRVAIGQCIPESMDQQLRRAAVDQSRAMVQGMIASLDAFHLDPVYRLRRAENKELQLKIAKEAGLRIPRTLITNDPDAVRCFAPTCRQGMVMKTFSSFAIYERGEQKVVFTSTVEPKDLEHLADLRYCPATFQERVQKALELRVTIIGDQIFGASIDSQRHETTRVDWRRDGLGLIDEWESYSLPRDVEEGLLKLMRRLELNYGAADLILTPDGDHVFLEVNPVGEFFWLEKHPGLPISQAIASLLVSNGHAATRTGSRFARNAS
jgi:MvdD family ATP-grasp ribosomal peptide maturase